ncbi:hypothetical protein DPEC_G00282290 [Dallia pectoralis]|uniref:Uncharacterized protein n=1 Tax=Dallia pectoralis TaxID=75939 RepID=A0ACC2FN07_DALPE|nr:hypothetical protein DPEC_G00282290 [Dallia pectoralis]
MKSEKGLKIHQGRKKCLKELTKGPRIDHYFLREGLKGGVERKLEKIDNLQLRDPYKFAKELFAKEKTGTLKVPVRKLEEHLRKTYSDNQRQVPATIPDDMPPIQPPEHQLDTRPPTWSEVKDTVKRTRTASAPGPNGVPYRLYKKVLWKLMKVTWGKGIIPRAWRRAGGILIPKEKNSSTIHQFRQISWNVEGKIFFSVVSQRLSIPDNYVDTAVQKAGISGFSGCLEHANVIWH